MTETRFRDLDVARAALDRVLEVQRQIDALAAARAEALVAFEAAFDAAYPAEQRPLRDRALRAELACALRLPERSAETLLGEASFLVRQLPATLRSLQAGRISYRHAQVMVDESSILSPEDRAALETDAVQHAERLTVAKFRRRVRTLRERRHPESMPERCRVALDERSVWIQPGSDGMAYLTAHLGAVEAEAIYARLSDAARAARSDGEGRTLAQLRADLLTDVLLGRTASGGRFDGVRPTVVVTVPMLTLLGRSVEPAILEGVGPIDAETARELTSEAPSLYRMLTDPATGAPLSTSPESYRIPEALRIWLRIRDGSCTFPGCAVSTRHSDIDHTHDWAHGGRSLDGNLAHLSRGHHTLKHHGGWMVDQRQPGRLVWTSFLGKTYEVEPEFAGAPSG